MAISTTRLKIRKAQKKEAKAVAEAAARQARRQRKRKGFLGKFSGILGGGLGALLGGALGVASGGLLMPLIMGASTLAAKKGLDEATKRGVLGRGLMGYDPRALRSAKGKYGFAREQQQEVMKELKAGTRERSTLMDELGKAYAGASLGALTGQFKQALKTGGVKGAWKELGKGKTWLGQSGEGVTGTGGGFFGAEKGQGWQGVKDYGKQLWSGIPQSLQGQKDAFVKMALERGKGEVAKQVDPSGALSSFVSDPSSLQKQFEVGNLANTLGVGGDYSNQVGQILDKTKISDYNIAEGLGMNSFASDPTSPQKQFEDEEGYELDTTYGFSKGGRVPKYQQGGGIQQQQQMNTQALKGEDLLSLLMSQQPQDKESLDADQGGVPTIVEYFNSQGKTYGGSSTKSLSQMLGR